MTAGCAGCHGLDAGGGTGMPPISTGLTDAQIAEIVSFLRSVAATK